MVCACPALTANNFLICTSWGLSSDCFHLESSLCLVIVGFYVDVFSHIYSQRVLSGRFRYDPSWRRGQSSPSPQGASETITLSASDYSKNKAQLHLHSVHFISSWIKQENFIVKHSSLHVKIPHPLKVCKQLLDCRKVQFSSIQVSSLGERHFRLFDYPDWCTNRFLPSVINCVYLISS